MNLIGFIKSMKIKHRFLPPHFFHIHIRKHDSQQSWKEDSDQIDANIHKGQDRKIRVQYTVNALQLL